MKKVALSLAVFLACGFGIPGKSFGYQSGTITAWNTETGEMLTPVPIETTGDNHSAPNLGFCVSVDGVPGEECYALTIGAPDQKGQRSFQRT